MILHEYTINFIIPSTQVEPNMGAFYAQLQELFQARDMSLNGIKSGNNTDYSSEMSVLVMTKPPAPPTTVAPAPAEQIKNLQIKEKAK